jgi:hypothetical protein
MRKKFNYVMREMGYIWSMLVANTFNFWENYPSWGKMMRETYPEKFGREISYVKQKEKALYERFNKPKQVPVTTA